MEENTIPVDLDEVGDVHGHLIDLRGVVLFAGPDKYCSPRHRMTFKSRTEGRQMWWATWRALWVVEFNVVDNVGKMRVDAVPTWRALWFSSTGWTCRRGEDYGSAQRCGRRGEGEGGRGADDPRAYTRPRFGLTEAPFVGYAGGFCVSDRLSFKLS